MSQKTQRFHHVNEKYRDFKVVKSIEIAELHCHLCELIHEPTSAMIIHLSNYDPENLFCLSFQTIPESSNGIAHVLEHTVLCGSQKYPVKDPFFAMNRRSLNTFMNALTGADFTCYPAATQVPKDFYNLLEVYIDAVFHPNLQLMSFLQEGCRLEFLTPTDPTTSLEYKGIVFNEMKGAMASPGARMSEALNEALFPHLTYGYNSGGDPAAISSLTYEELIAFHKKFYHPSRCLFFFYGNLPLVEHLDFIESKILKDSTKLAPLPSMPEQPRFTTPKRIVKQYPISPDEPMEGKTMISFGWLTCNIVEQEELLALGILEFHLLDSDASPLKMALLKSGLCKQVSSHMESEQREVPFTITLRGCNSADAGRLEEIIRITLERVAISGIPLIQLENALHQLELHRSEITHDHGPFGLSLFMRSALLKQHGANSEDGLHIHSLSESIRKRNLADPNYFSDLIRKHLCQNNHFVRIVMEPDDTLATREIEEEKLRLENIRNALSPEEMQKIVDQASDLLAFQEMQEEVDQNILPKVTLEDVPKITRDLPLQQENVGNLTVFHHNTFTNGILYADLVYSLPKIAEEDLPFVKLFAALVTQVGCGGRDYVENLEYIQAHTGGISVSLTFNLQAHNSLEFYPSICIRGKALHRKAEKLLRLFSELATSADFSDLPRLREVIIKHFTALQSILHQSSLRYAINLSASALDIPSHIANAWYGLEYYSAIKAIADDIDQVLPQIAQKLKSLQHQLFCLDDPHLVLTCESVFYDELKNRRFYALADIPTKPFKPWSADYALQKIPSQGRITASPIAFIGKVLKTVSYTHPDAPALNIAAFLCDNLVLHAKIREQGGAYGGGAVCSSMAANFYFYSYRDPNITTSLNAFNEAIDEVAAGNFDDSDLEEAKLEMIQILDSPITPGSRGDLAYGWLREGKSLAVRQYFRDQILALTAEDVSAAVTTHILPQMKEGVVVVFAGKDLLEMENKILQESGHSPLILEKIS